MNPPHIQKLSSLFDSQPVRTILAGSKMYRGCWLPKTTFPNGNWFAPTMDDAAEYIAMHADYGRAQGLSPHIFECSVVQTVVFVELHQSHITAFSNAYGHGWTHAQLIEDIPRAFRLLGNTNWAGFCRPNTQEYFFCDPVAVLKQGNILLKDDALKEASRVKGYTV